MKPSSIKFHELERWIKANRKASPCLQNEANSMLGRLAQFAARQSQIDALSHAPLTFGLYGCSKTSKSYLLKNLLAAGSDHITVQLGDKTLNYLRHINPEKAMATMAVRLTSKPAPEVENYPLLLNLLTEEQLATPLVQRYHARGEPRLLSESAMYAKLDALQNQRQPQPVPGMNQERFAAVARSYQQQVRGDHYPDDELLWQMAELAPWLTLNDRASLLSLFWGEEQSLTQSWLELAQALHLLGCAEQVLAPASLVVDNFLLPVEGFLVAAQPRVTVENVGVIVCTLRNGEPLTHINIPQRALQAVCAECVLTLSQATNFSDLDIVDIPRHEHDRYTAAFQPDILMVCNAVDSPEEIAPVASTLNRWLEQTQGKKHEGLPRLIWAITPFDSRFTQKVSLDDRVQHSLTQSGKQWGTLQVLESHSIDRLREWLASALSPSSRRARQHALQHLLNQEVDAQFSPICAAGSHEQTPALRAEKLIRVLQSQGARQGKLLESLTLPREIIRQCWQRFEQQRLQCTQSAYNIDLFATENKQTAANPDQNSFARQLHKRWVKYLRQLGYRNHIAVQASLAAPEIQALCKLLIDTSYRLDLGGELEIALRQHDSNSSLTPTCAGNVLNDFIGWLGYEKVPLAQRPLSRINNGKTIFSPPLQADATTRLTQLGEHQVQGNASYLYDWLVALYVRATENSQQQPREVCEEQRELLARLLKS